jgi:hypothetical protein
MTPQRSCKGATNTVKGLPDLKKTARSGHE